MKPRCRADPSRWVGILFVVGMFRLPEAAAQEPLTVLVRACDGTDAAAIANAARMAAEGARAITEPADRPADLVADVCIAESVVTSTLTDLASGRTDPRSAPNPADTGPDGPRRLVAWMLRQQIRCAIDRASGREPEPAAPEPAPEVAPEPPVETGPPAAPVPPAEPESIPVGIDVAATAEAAGKINAQTDAAGFAIGPTVSIDAAIDDRWLVGVALSALTIPTDGSGPSIVLLPMRVRLGAMFDLGPVAVGGVLSGIAECWLPSAAPVQTSWRGGVGLDLLLDVPVGWWLSVRVDAGADFFTRSSGFQYNDDIIAEVSNWRWRAGVGLAVEIPVR